MERFDQLKDKVLQMGEYAVHAQKDISVSFKSDGSALTQTDLYISEQLSYSIHQLFPDANIMSEESLFPFDESKEFTFIIDPIDGTDAYSQGLPGWCVSIGIIDTHRAPVGAMVYAPRWGLSRDEGLFLRLDPGKKLMMNNNLYVPRLVVKELEQLTMASHASRYVSMKKYEGKIRCFGSNILHMISPLIHSHIQGSLSVPCYVWDVAGAHALLVNQGFTTVFEDDSPFIYTDALLKERQMFQSVLYSGTKEAVETMKTLFSKT